MCEEAERQGYSLDNMYQKALGSSAGTVEMYCNPDGASSSLLKPKLHLQVSPDVIFDTRETVEVITLDSLLEDDHPYNFINMDVQGFELEVLKGASKTLDKVKYVLATYILGDLFLLSRISHAYGITRPGAESIFRMLGATGTFLILATQSIWALKISITWLASNNFGF